MLYLRLGELTSPIALKCSFCPRITPSGDPVYFQEVMTDRRPPKQTIVLEQVETMCAACLAIIKGQAMKFKIKIEFDYEFGQKLGDMDGYHQEVKLIDGYKMEELS